MTADVDVPTKSGDMAEPETHEITFRGHTLRCNRLHAGTYLLLGKLNLREISDEERAHTFNRFFNYTLADEESKDIFEMLLMDPRVTDAGAMLVELIEAIRAGQDAANEGNREQRRAVKRAARAR